MYKRIFTLLALTLASIALVAGLYAISLRSVSKPNGFDRQFLPDVTAVMNDHVLRFGAQRITMLDKSDLYLNSNLGLDYLFRINVFTGDTVLLKLPVERVEGIRHSRAAIEVQFPYYFVMGPRIPFVYKGNLKTNSIGKYCSNKAMFHDVFVVRDSQFVYRMFHPAKGAYLAKTSNDGKLLEDKKLLQAQGDPIFSKDGMMQYDAATGKVVYVYYYRNQFVVADTALNLLYRGKTIDTISVAKVSSGKIDRGRGITMSSPPLVVNRKSCVSNNLLFIQSALKADNEQKEAFESNEVIDVYDLGKGNYRFSFYLPKGKKEKLLDMKVNGDVLVVLYKGHVKVYRLKLPLSIKKAA